MTNELIKEKFIKKYNMMDLYYKQFFKYRGRLQNRREFSEVIKKFPLLTQKEDEQKDEKFNKG